MGAGVEPAPSELTEGDTVARITKGMDVEQIEQMGARLQTDQVERVRLVATDIDQMVANVQWLGRDAERFRGWWPEKRSALNAIADDLHGFGQSAINNAAEQKAASRVTANSQTASNGRSGRHDQGKDFENRTGFSADRSVGFVLRRGVQDGFEASYGRDRTEISYSTARYFSVESDDLVQAAEFVATVKGSELDSPIDLGVEFRGFEGTQFLWRQETGDNSVSLRGLNELPVRMTEGWNIVDGYTAEEVMADIQAGELPPPDAVATYSGVSTASSLSIEAGSSVFGADGEVSVQRFLERNRDGSHIGTIAMTGSSSSNAGIHLDAGLNSGVDLKAVSGTESSVELSTVYNPQGEAVALEYKVISHAEVGSEVEVGFAGGGAYESASNGVLVERTLTFDLTDPGVADVVAADSSTNGLAWHSDWASEEIRVFGTESQGQGADAILFKFDSEAESMSLIESQFREPNRSDALIQGNPEVNRQYVTNPDGTRSTIYTDGF